MDNLVSANINFNKGSLYAYNFPDQFETHVAGHWGNVSVILSSKNKILHAQLMSFALQQNATNVSSVAALESQLTNLSELGHQNLNVAQMKLFIHLLVRLVFLRGHYEDDVMKGIQICFCEPTNHDSKSFFSLINGNMFLIGGIEPNGAWHDDRPVAVILEEAAAEALDPPEGPQILVLNPHI
jgi:hypothetical protein